MAILEHPEAVALLQDALLSEEQLLHLSQRLQPFLERYLPATVLIFAGQVPFDQLARTRALGPISSTTTNTR